ncbi:hypothetical protein A2Z67_02365 [Candidatus Woesebacteria bacterium RBG_13_36_22]|uniref:Uncharacterized protein n=1 Tax=Candidatus Woesebacteria bacterium RBG_13_36_22 TaxID=1802478 RepID=A0A1F7X373_9BACT|nr:MAG: hypothetical protein A2Z67_02365 [Candidatus Woesebacteria bacterium RBG_13_36_22]
MSKNEVVNIYLDVHYLEMEDTNEGFKLVLYGRTNKGEGKSHKIYLNFSSFWIRFFLKDFRKLLTRKREVLDELESGFNK